MPPGGRTRSFASMLVGVAWTTSTGCWHVGIRCWRRTRLFLPIRFPVLCRHDRTCQEAKIAFDKRQLDQPEIVERQFLVACRNGTTLFQPAHALLNGTASAILLTVIRYWATTLAFPRA